MLDTPEEIANARRNVGRYAWARVEMEGVLTRRRRWMERSDAESWSMVTGQNVPRGIHVNPDLGCPSCGRDLYRFGSYPWEIAPERPWKLECPSCGTAWPKNDFDAFHKSGLGDGGVFRRDLADESLLYNTDHPDPGDPLHGYGVGNEASPGYCFIWMNLFLRYAQVLERCRAHRDYDLFCDFPWLRRMVVAPCKLTALDRCTPNIGDTGYAGAPGMAAAERPMVLDALQRFGDPFFARFACLLNGDAVEGLHGSIWDTEPEAIREGIRAAVPKEGALRLESANANGYGLAMLRAGDGGDCRAAWLSYGRGMGHGHLDRLNLGLYFRGMDILPDLGYPEYADMKWPNRAGWTKNTISHNTVTVDARAQTADWTGHCARFAAGDGMGAVEVGFPAAYPGLRDCRRTLAMVDLDGRYAGSGFSYLYGVSRAADVRVDAGGVRVVRATVDWESA